MPNHHKHLSSLRIQHGQAMIEYAILLLLLVMIFVGGAEIGSTALASYKTTDAVKAAANEFAEINQLMKTEIHDAQKEYLAKLAALGITEIDSNGTSSGTLIYDNYVEYLRALPDQNADNVIDEDDYLALFAQAQFNTIDGGDNIVTQLEANAAADSVEKFKAIIILRQIALFDMPTIADHNDGGIIMASCDDTNNLYLYGLPDRYPYNDSDDDGVFELNDTDEKKVYLFHPLVINAQSCSGVDATRAGKSRLSILVNGYGNFEDANNDGLADDPLFVPGMPKLNQATYGIYTRVCLDTSNNYISCSSNNVVNIYLKPPGKVCFDDTECPNNPNLDLVAGFYRWGKGSDSDEKNTYDIGNLNDDLLNGFRPTFQIECQTTSSFDVGDTSDDDCQDNPKKVRVHTRYRKVFEGFLTFGLRELSTNFINELPLFYNPNNVGLSDQVNGIVGSEIGPLGANQRPTVKMYRDFRGCYEVNVETNQVSACN